MRKFFRNLRSAFTGAGYETADDVFGKVERGELKAAKTAKAEEAKPSLTAKKEEKVDPNDVSRVVTDGPYADAAVRTMNSQITQTSNPLEVDDYLIRRFLMSSNAEAIGRMKRTSKGQSTKRLQN